VAAAVIELNGDPITPTWTSVTRWSVTIALVPGANALAFQAYSSLGDLLGSDSIIVTAGPPPAISAIFPEEGPATGGTQVSIIGTGFQETSSAQFGDIPAATRYESPTLLVATAPPGRGEVAITVHNADLQSAASPTPYRYVPVGSVFARADANADGDVDVADAVSVLYLLFSGGTIPCLKAADANDDGTLDVDDPIRLLAYLFADETLPPPTSCGTDPSEDELTCEAYPPCPEE
jgi:hypothetical protein